MMDLQNKRVLVVGLAKSGLAAIELLEKHGAHVRAIDQRTLAELGDAGQKLQAWGVPLLPQAAESFTDADLVVLSPGVAIDAPEVLAAKQQGIAVTGEMELASWFLRGPIIGITGANGKTTTTALIGHILKQSGIPTQVGGNIGTAPAAMIDDSRDDQWNVLEASSFQLETIQHFRAKIAVCTNVTPDHLDRHHTFENYVAAKRQLFRTQTADDYAVLNADDAVCVAYASCTKARPLWFSSTHPVGPGMYVDDDRISWDGEAWINTSDIPLVGVHNVENTMAAALACRVAGASREQIASAVKTFPGVEHRIEFVRERNGVRFYNDSKATNVDATLKAIAAFAGGLWIILGGKDKDSDYTVLREPLRKKARKVLLIGAAAHKIEDHLSGAVPVEQCGTIDKAVQRGADAATAGEVVLLAPACASFDQFQNYEQRGRVFKDLVNHL